MTATFTFNYTEYLKACRAMFGQASGIDTTLIAKHLFGVKISTSQVSSTELTGGGDEWTYSYFASGATTPELTCGILTRKFQGVEMRIPSISNFGEKTLTLTFFDTQDRFIYNALRIWADTLVETRFTEADVGKVDLTQINENDYIIIQALTTNGSNAPSWCLYGAYPQKFTEVKGLNQDELTEILSFDVEFKYRFAAYGVVAQGSDGLVG